MTLLHLEQLNLDRPFKVEHWNWNSGWAVSKQRLTLTTKLYLQCHMGQMMVLLKTSLAFFSVNNICYVASSVLSILQTKLTNPAHTLWSRVQYYLNFRDKEMRCRRLQWCAKDYMAGQYKIFCWFQSAMQKNIIGFVGIIIKNKYH